MKSTINVLLVEKDTGILSSVVGFLTDVKECRLETVSSVTQAKPKLASFQADLILLLEQPRPISILADLRRLAPEAHIIVSVDAQDQDQSTAVVVAGANDYVRKDDHHINNLIQAIKKALIQISEREAFHPSVHSSLNPFAIDENLPDIVFSSDVGGKLLHLNKAVSSLLGYEPTEMVGRDLIEFFARESDVVRFQSYLQNVRCEIHFHETVSLRNSLGMEEDFEINCAFMEGDHIFGLARKYRPEDGFDNIEVLEESAVDEETPPRLDHFRIVTLLGAGGMGRVYLAMDEGLERPVAIKVLSNKLSSDHENLEKFRREAKILASITHPNIALIYFFGGGVNPFFSMEYLPGGSLKDLLRKKGTLPAETAASYALQVALGLNEALSKRVIHLDIKPSNLMVAEDRRIKIVDFGLARNNPDPGDEAQDIVGTPYYVAPEQILSGIADYRSDIYSLGITLFEMLYGFVPFCGNTIKETFNQCLADEIPSREELNPDVPKQLDSIMRKMVARDPMKRHASYAELICDLQNFIKAAGQKSGKRTLRALRPAAKMWGNLYDRPFPEVLGRIVMKSLSGRLTLQWMDLRKEIHFRNGKIVAVFSNQEGEKFVECVLEKHRITAEKARQVKAQSSTSYDQYFSITRDADPELRRILTQDLQILARRILSGLFGLTLGDFIFEEGDFSGQFGLELDAREIISAGVKERMSQDAIEQRTDKGNCRIELNPEFHTILKGFPVSPADVFMLFRFEKIIGYNQLQVMSGIPDAIFSRLIYLFHCLNVVEIQVDKAQTPSKPLESPAPVRYIPQARNYARAHA